MFAFSFASFRQPCVNFSTEESGAMKLKEKTQSQLKNPHKFGPGEFVAYGLTAKITEFCALEHIKSI